MYNQSDDDLDYCKNCGNSLLFPDKPCPKCKSSQSIQSSNEFIEGNNDLYNENLKLNFRFSKAFNDLFSNKRYIWELLLLVVLFFISSMFAQSPLSLSIINGTSLFGYMSIMANNIIQDQKPVLAGIYNSNIFLAGFKQIVIQFIYFIPLGILLSLITMFLEINYKVKHQEATILIIFIFLPLIFFLLISAFTLFAENLSFKDSFNLMKSIKLSKYAWKGYLVSSILYILITICILLFNNLFKIFNNSIIIMISNLITCSFLVIASYFWFHFVAQSYKYALVNYNKNKHL